MTDLRSLLSEADLGYWNWELFLPVSINSAGQLCGTTYAANDPGVPRVLRISLSDEVGVAAVVEDVSPTDAVSSSTGGINEYGDVAGSWFDSNGDRRAFVFSDDVTKSTTDIGHLGGL